MKNSYYVQARLFPTILTIIPLLILTNSVIINSLTDKLESVLKVLPILTNLGLSAALIFLMVQINRFVAKEVFQNLFFKDEMLMPTTNHLLWKDEYFEDSIKAKIRQKILEMFELNLYSEEQEIQNETNARKLIITAVSQIRNVLRGNKLLLQHNIEYGFFRNLFGGSLMAILFSLLLIIYGFVLNTSGIIVIGSICFLLYLILVLVGKKFIKKYGDYYSKILYEQFLTI